MKRFGNLFDKICDLDNIRNAFKRAAKGKKWRRTVKYALAHMEQLSVKLREVLLSGEYHTSKYKTRTIYEPKQRTIYILPFYPDRVVHHAVMAVIEPLLDKMMYFHSYACRPGKGQIKGSNQCMKYAVKYEYCLKCDVSKFYPSVDHAILKELLRKKFKDARLLALLDEIIDSADGDKTVPAGKNVPIGNYLSQWFGNYYLNELDTFVKQVLRCKPYIRYCDDFTLFSDDKRELREWADKIREFCLNNLKLTLSKCNIFKTSQGVDFLGYRHFRNGRLILRKRTALRLRRRLKTIARLMTAAGIANGTAGITTAAKTNGSHRFNRQHALGQTASAMGLLRHCKSKGLRQTTGIKQIFENLRHGQECGQELQVAI